MTASSPKVLVVIGSLDRGGCETHLLRVLPDLKQEGITPEVFLFADDGPLAPLLEQAGVKLIRPWLKRDQLRQEKDFIALLIKVLSLGLVSIQFLIHLVWHRPDIVHFFLPASYLWGAPLALIARQKKLLMSRRSLNNYQQGDTWYRWCEMRLHPLMSRILVNSKAITEQLVKIEKVEPQKITLIYNGVKQPIIDEVAVSALRTRFITQPSNILIGCVANLIPYKGHADLLEALALLKSHRGWRLVLAGRDTGYGLELKQKAQDLGIDDRVVFLGEYDDVWSLYHAVDLVILPSHQEGFSNALIEAMSAGKAIVATDVGGNAEALDFGVNGLLVRPQNPVEMASAINQLLTKTSLRQEMGQKAKDNARTYFSHQTCVQLYGDLYKNLLQ